MKVVVFCLSLIMPCFCFAQQTEEFRFVKNYYNHHRTLLGKEFKKKLDTETNTLKKDAIKKDFILFMRKMDSIENTALIGALLKVKNIEDLNTLQNKNIITKNTDDKVPYTTDKSADYPGGVDALRKEVAHLFYGGSVYSETPNIKTNVKFIVEKDGSISNVKAEGENFTFNRQAEIAIYSISEKFSPAVINGTPVRYRFNLPLTFSFK
ncbi:energy transducer TonB [Chryseobacterium nematophagum]|uniref:energy transducer TonB n=1 Tax=Chryseobacterium nematophagum TaxID=2305228 RepID=UPI001E5CC935|nr:hypothetical protein [Chryseobacterium nematophagum]